MPPDVGALGARARQIVKRPRRILGVEVWSEIWYNMCLQFGKGFVSSWFIWYLTGTSGKSAAEDSHVATCADGGGVVFWRWEKCRGRGERRGLGRNE